MFFTSRHELGIAMAQNWQVLRTQEPIIVCLKESGLSVAISLASELHGWVFPLLSEPVAIPGDNRMIGSINQDGTLCYNIGLSTYEREELEMEYMSVIQEASREAYSRLNRRLEEWGDLNKAALRGRTVIICGDIVRDQLELSAALELLKTVKTQSVVCTVGNVNPDTSTAMMIHSDETNFMDVMQQMFDDEHYFEQPDPYTDEQKRQLALNIAQYWN